MKKLLFITLLFLVLLSACIEQPSKQPTTTTTMELTTITEEHHGTSSLGKCSDDDCYITGCNKEICQSRFEEPMLSICVYDPPYPAQLGYECKCVDQKCMWTK